MAFAIPLIPSLIATGSAAIGGIITYFAFKQGGVNNSNSGNTDSKGEIMNNVQLDVKDNSPDILVSLVAILVMFKFMELFIFCARGYQRSLKKRYGTPPQIPQVQQQQV